MSADGALTPTVTIIKPPPFEFFIIPSKATKDVDWGIQLKSYIMDLGEDLINFASEIATFNRMRQDMRGAPGTALGISLTLAYYQQLDSLSRRLPLAEKPPSLPFQWHDAFDPDISVRQTSVAFEKANVLFNLAAAFCQTARQGEETAAKNLQLAASILSFLKDNFLHPPLLDIKEPCVNWLVAVLLAQAQETVVVRALQEEKSLTTVARLAASAARYAMDARRLLSVSELADLRSCLYGGVNDGDESIDAISLIQMKAGAWEAIAYYLRGEVAYREGAIGEAIARLRMAREMAETTQTVAPSANSSLNAYLTKLVTHLKGRLPAIEKENTLIYTQRIPETASRLEDLPSASLVKILSWSEMQAAIFPKQASDLFRRLLPLHVHEELSRYSEEKSKLLRYETLKVTTADTELQTTLSSLGFPSALDALVRGPNQQKDKTILPEEFAIIRDKAEDLRVERREADMKRSLERLGEALAKIGDDLDGEIAENQRGRVQWGVDRWTQTPSHQSNGQLFEQLAAQQQQLRSLVNKHRNIPVVDAQCSADFARLTGPIEELHQLLPQPDNWLEDSRLAYGKQVQAQLSELEELARDRSRFLEELKSALLADDISDALAITRTNDTMSLFHRELAKFDNQCARIEENVSTHGARLADFCRLWQEIQHMGRSRESEQLFQDLLHRFTAALQSHQQRVGRLEELRGEIHQLELQVAELARQTFVHVEMRTQERQSIVSRLQREDSERGQQYLLDRLRRLSTKDSRHDEIQKKLNQPNSHLSSIPDGETKDKSMAKIPPPKPTVSSEGKKEQRPPATGQKDGQKPTKPHGKIASAPTRPSLLD